MLNDFSTRMKHAVQQENRSLTTSIQSSSTSNNSKRQQQQQQRKVGLVIILFVVLLLVVAALIFLQAYNSIQQYKDGNDHKMADILKLTEQEEVEKEAASKKDILVLSMKQLGEIRVVLRPDLSAGSVEYIQTLVDSKKCDRCSFYRADQRGILQGIMKNANIPTNTDLGPCPEGLDGVVKNDCPDWDKHCGCHGPIMTRGAVAWAAGQAGGPDFFIDNYRRPANWWGTQHTNFGFIEDEDSLRIVDTVFDQPTKNSGGLTMLVDPVHFDLRLERE